nr:peptidase [Gemmatimonadaceae bacterium]
MKISTPVRACVSALIAIALSAGVAAAQRKITTPREQFGKPIGADYFLINYTQFLGYWEKLARQSDRMKLTRIGTSVEGRPMMMAIISSPSNLRNLSRYQEIASRLANAEGLTDMQARALAAEGKAVVWIDGGLHGSEVLGSQQLVQTTYDLLSSNDAEMQRILSDVIVLLVPANPDGWELVANWYMREPDTLKRTTQYVPVLYQHYIGHDNNRDTYMASQPETQAMDSVLFRAWYPQIMYNHHQSGPEGTVLFAPPFRDPFNYNVDPLVVTELDLVGAAMHSRFVAENKPGATMRTGANYSTWFNGGMRTTTYFHNIIGLLTETIGNPTPTTIPLVPNRLLSAGVTPFPINPQPWHFAQSLAYSITANRAVLDVASRYRETFLFNIYQMGRNSIQRGSRDTWTRTPHRLEEWKGVIARDTEAGKSRTTAEYMALLNSADTRDPRGYIIPSNQRDFPTAVKFVNTLVKNGITVHRATHEFS